MKRQGILNGDISSVLSYMGHTDRICIGDCGLPIPDSTKRIDLALKFGQPSFMDVLEEVGKDMKIEKIILAEEIKEQNPEILCEIWNFFGIRETGCETSFTQEKTKEEIKEKTQEKTQKEEYGLDTDTKEETDKEASGIEVEFVSHSQLKEKTKDCKAVIRTGETTPYANIILQSGCIF